MWNSNLSTVTQFSNEKLRTELKCSLLTCYCHRLPWDQWGLESYVCSRRIGRPPLTNESYGDSVKMKFKLRVTDKFLSKPASTAARLISPQPPDAAHCLSGHRSCYSRKSPSPWIFCTAHRGAAAQGVPSPCSPWPGRQANTGLGGWVWQKDKATEEKEKLQCHVAQWIKCKRKGVLSSVLTWGRQRRVKHTFFLMGTATLDLIWLKVFIKNFESSGDGANFSGLSIPKWCFLQS